MKKTKLILLLTLVLLPMCAMAQSDPIKERLETMYVDYDVVLRWGEGTADNPFYYRLSIYGKVGIFDAQGREIIPPLKYDDVSRRGSGTAEDPFWYEVELFEHHGACDVTGREIIPPLHEDFLFYGADGFYVYVGEGKSVLLNVYLNPDGTLEEKNYGSQVLKQCRSCGGSGRCSHCKGTGHKRK